MRCQHRQGLDQRFGLGIRLARRGAERGVDLLEKRNQIGRPRELPDERQVVVERRLNRGQIVCRDEKQGLRAQHRRILLIKNVAEQIGFRRHFHGQPLDKLPVFLRVAAFHDHHQVVALLRKLLLQREKIPVILQVGTHEIVAVRVKLQQRDSDQDAGNKQRQLRPKKPARMTNHRRRQSAQQPREQRIGAQCLHGSGCRADSCFHRFLGKFRVGENFLHVVVLLQGFNQFVDRGQSGGIGARRGKRRQRRDFRRLAFDAFGLDLFYGRLRNFAGSVKIS